MPTSRTCDPPVSLLYSELPLSELAHKNLEDLRSDLETKFTVEDRNLALELFALLDRASKGQKSPRLFQVEAAVSIIRGKDTIVRAGTSYGKTLVMVLVLLYCEDEVAVTIAPLKCLQNSLVDEFEKYGIRSIAINGDSTETNLFDDILEGKYRNFLIAPEQCAKNDRGIKTTQAPCFALLLNIPKFRDTIKKVFIDEVHFCVTAGLSNGFDGAFRPVYACLDGLRVRLPARVPFALFSATLPNHIKEKLWELLLLKPNTTLIDLPTNRPNFTYAAIPMEGSIGRLKNLDFLVPPVPLERLPFNKFLIWIENSKAADKIARYLSDRLPAEARDSNPIVHIHSGMSSDYKSKVLSELCEVGGSKRGVVATGAMSNGIHVPDIDAVIFYGTAEIPVDFEQKAGRGGRDGRPCLILTIAEHWLYDEPPTAAERAKANPKATGAPAKRLRTADEMFEYVRMSSCKPAFIAKLNDDNTPLNPSGVCCDAHEEFNLSAALRLAPFTLPPGPENPKKQRAKYRKTEDRGDLETILKQWRTTACLSSPTAQFWDESLILTDDDIVKLAMAEPKKFQSSQDLIELLDESADWALYWAERILAVIHHYNADTGRFTRRIRARRQAEREAAGESEPEYESEERDPVSEFSVEGDSDSDIEMDVASHIDPDVPQSPCAIDDAAMPAVPMDEDDFLDSRVDKIVASKQSLVAGNSYSVKLHRESKHKRPHANAQNQPLFSNKPLILKRDASSTATSHMRWPLIDKTNGNDPK